MREREGIGLPSFPMYAVSTKPAIGSAAKLAKAGKAIIAISLSSSVNLSRPIGFLSSTKLKQIPEL